MALGSSQTLEVQRRVVAVLERIQDNAAYLTLRADLTTLRPRCRFALGTGGALAARYLDLPFAAVSFFGHGEGLRAALGALLGTGEPCYALLGESQRARLGAVTRVLHVDPEWQMICRGKAEKLQIGSAVSLHRPDLPAMRGLAERGELMAFEANALEKGPYFGVWRDGCLASMAGTHLKLERMAEIGNVVTDPEYCRQGLASMAVAATLQTLTAVGLQVIVQVFKSNAAAIARYEKLGFERSRTMYLVQFTL